MEVGVVEILSGTLLGSNCSYSCQHLNGLSHLNKSYFSSTAHHSCLEERHLLRNYDTCCNYFVRFSQRHKQAVGYHELTIFWFDNFSEPKNSFLPPKVSPSWEEELLADRRDSSGLRSTRGSSWWSDLEVAGSSPGSRGWGRTSCWTQPKTGSTTSDFLKWKHQTQMWSLLQTTNKALHHNYKGRCSAYIGAAVSKNRRQMWG